MSLTKYNKEKSVDWGIKTDGWEFKKLSELTIGVSYNMRGIFIIPDHGYGKSAAIISDQFLVSLPERFVETAKDIMADPEAVEGIKAGKNAFVVSTFTSKKHNRTGYDIEFIDK